jgi:hypothetical protein
MLDGDDKQTFYSLMRLRDVASSATKPFVLWIGAGASRWCGYPSWEDLGSQLHRLFSTREANYQKPLGEQLIAAGKLPAVFSLCKSVNSALYYGELDRILCRTSGARSIFLCSHGSTSRGADRAAAGSTVG